MKDRTFYTPLAMGAWFLFAVLAIGDIGTSRNGQGPLAWNTVWAVLVALAGLMALAWRAGRADTDDEVEELRARVEELEALAVGPSETAER